MDNNKLKYYADQIRKLSGKAFLKAKMGHLGGAYSIADCIAVLFFKYLRDDPKDWFILSKGHSGPAYYAALVLKKKISEEDLYTLNMPGTIVPSHPDRLRTNGVDCSTGSLGQGISQAVGIAYGLKIQNKEGKVYCIIGDGECNEGEVWEAFQFASNKKLNNLIIIVDNNLKQVDGLTEKVSFKFNFNQIGNLFDFSVIEIDGNNVSELDNAFSKTESSNKTSFIIMNTIKGKGIPYFEKMSNCHHVRFGVNEVQAMEEYIKKWDKEVMD